MSCNEMESNPKVQWNHSFTVGHTKIFT